MIQSFAELTATENDRLTARVCELVERNGELERQIESQAGDVIIVSREADHVAQCAHCGNLVDTRNPDRY